MKHGPIDLASLTKKYFSHRELEDHNFFLAFTEVMAHVELMQEAGDISVITKPTGSKLWSNGLGPEILVCWDETDKFSSFIDNL